MQFLVLTILCFLVVFGSDQKDDKNLGQGSAPTKKSYLDTLKEKTAAKYEQIQNDPRTQQAKEKLAETGTYLKDKAEEGFGKAKPHAINAWDYTKNKTSEMKTKAQPHLDMALDYTKEKGSEFKTKAQPHVDTVKEKASAFKEKYMDDKPKTEDLTKDNNKLN